MLLACAWNACLISSHLFLFSWSSLLFPIAFFMSDGASDVDSLSESGSLESPVSEDDDGSFLSDEEMARPDLSAIRKQLPVNDMEAADFSAIFEQSLKDDIEKGRAAKRQLGQ